MHHPIDRLKGVRFQPGLVPTLAAGVALVLTVHLGNWQRGRAAEKSALQEQFDDRAKQPALRLPGEPVGEAAIYRSAMARGRYDADGQFFIDNRSEQSAVGYHVVTPLQLEGDKGVLLVNRGFIPRGPAYPAPPVVAVPSGVIDVQGMLSRPNAKFLELGAASPVQGAVWQNLTVDRYRQRTGREVLDLVLLANPTNSGLRAVIERPDAKVEKHVEYMLTWYCLAATVVVLWLTMNLKFSQKGAAQ
jgi:cytochrome oxidase assembly protein ShyY1